MTAPIESNDRRYAQAAVQEHIAEDQKELHLEGPDAREVKQAQKDAVSLAGYSVLLHEFEAKASEEGALHLAELAMKKGPGLLGRTLGPVATAMAPASAAITLTELWNKAGEEGEAQKQAYQRDAVTLAAVDVGAAALPAGYVQCMQKELGVSKGGATHIVENLMQKHGAQAWKAVKASTERLIHQGRVQAKKLGIHDAKTLEAKLSDRKSNFAVAYHSSLALRIGVAAEIWISK